MPFKTQVDLKRYPFPREDYHKLDVWRRQNSSIFSSSRKYYTELKKIGRRGIMDGHRGWAWSRVLRVEEINVEDRDYSTALHQIFGNTIPANTQAPFFGGTANFDKLALSENGIQTVKNILCIVAHYYANLNYSPIIPSIASILCHYMSPFDALGCLVAMIKDDRKEDWSFFPLHAREFLVFTRVFEQLVSKNVPNVAKHIAKLEDHGAEDSSPDWEHLLSSFFIGLFPMKTVVRIMDAYLIEKYKILFRFALAHVIVIESRLLMTRSISEFDEVLFNPVDSVDEIELFKVAFGLKISRNKIWESRRRHRKLSIGDFDKQDRMRIFHKPLPHLNQPSSFLRDCDLLNIWSWIPSRYKLMNLKLLYSHQDGYHLLNLYDKCREVEPLLICVETSTGYAFGAYLSKQLKPSTDEHFYGTGETFIFSLKPTDQKYPWEPSRPDQSFILASGRYIAIGAGR